MRFVERDQAGVILAAGSDSLTDPLEGTVTEAHPFNGQINQLKTI